MIAHHLVESVNIREEEVNAPFMETEIIVQVIDDQSCRGGVRGERLSLAGMYMVKVVSGDGKSILNQICRVPSAALAEDNFGATLIFLNLLLVDRREFCVTGGDGDHPKDLRIGGVLYSEIMWTVPTVFLV